MEVARAHWTVVIPAAGRGTRLGSREPKILCPVLGRSLLFWLVQALEVSAERFVFVVSNEGHAPISRAASTLLGSRAVYAIQEQPMGMADAVWTAKEHVCSEHVLVVWGDQVTISSATVLRCQRAHEAAATVAATLPIVRRERPYVAFDRDRAGHLVAVREAREGAIMPLVGESDCGIFAFRTGVLFQVLERARAEGRGIGAMTREWNLLPLLPGFEQPPGSVQTIPIDDVEQTLGINRRTDVDAAARVLARRAQGMCS